jgi:hypothetical protein
MFSLLKHLLWLIHIGAILYFVLTYVGYDINWHYFDTQKKACEERLAQCRQDLIKTGVEGFKETCDWKCANISPNLLIRKKTEPEQPTLEAIPAAEVPANPEENATIETP